MRKIICICILFFVVQFNTNAQQQGFFEDVFLERVWLSVTNSNGIYNETLIAFKPDATLGVDSAYDAEKLIGSEILSFYSKIGTNDYAIQALPSLLFDIDVPLGINADANGPLTLALEEEINFSQGAQLIVEDTKTGLFYNLRNEQSFTFQFDYLLDTLRFIAHFKPAPLYSALTGTCLLNDGSIAIVNHSETPWNVSILDLDSNILINNAEVDSFIQWSQFLAGFYLISFRNEFNAEYDVAIEIETALPIEMQFSASSTNVNLGNSTIDFTAILSGTDQIIWDFGDGTIDTALSQVSHTYNTPGIYTVTAIAGTPGCEQFDSEVITVTDIITSVESLNEVSSSVINGNLFLTFNQSFKPELIEMFDISGKLLNSKTINSSQQNIEIDCTSIRNQLILIRIASKTSEFKMKYFCNSL